MLLPLVAQHTEHRTTRVISAASVVSTDACAQDYQTLSYCFGIKLIGLELTFFTEQSNRALMITITSLVTSIIMIVSMRSL